MQRVLFWIQCSEINLVQFDMIGISVQCWKYGFIKLDHKGSCVRIQIFISIFNFSGWCLAIEVSALCSGCCIILGWLVSFPAMGAMKICKSSTIFQIGFGWEPKQSIGTMIFPHRISTLNLVPCGACLCVFSFID